MPKTNIMNDKLNIITHQLYIEYQKQLKEIGIKNEVVLGVCNDMFERLVKQIHFSNRAIQKALYGKSEKQLKFKGSSHIAQISYTISADGSSTLSLRLKITASKYLEPSFLRNKVKPLNGYVYFLESEFGVKIGKTIKLGRRMNEFGVKLPFDVNLKYFIFTVNYDVLEKDLHKLLKKSRLNGEWFDLDNKDWESINLLLEKEGLILKNAEQ